MDTPYQFCKLGHLISVCQFLSLCVNSLSIKALCIEGNSDSHYNFIDKVKMDRLLQPEKLETDPSSSTASKDWLHWLRTFENFLTVLPREVLDRFLVLTNYVSPRIFEYIEHCRSYDEAIGVMKAQYVNIRSLSVGYSTAEEWRDPG